MARSGGRPNPHVQESRPPAAGRPAPAPPDGDHRPPVWDGGEGQQTGWRLAATLWAIVFLFLAALMVFDLVAGLFHG